jgi:hypothetical protein
VKRILLATALAVAGTALVPAAPASAEPCEIACIVHRCFAFDDPIGLVCI